MSIGIVVLIATNLAIYIAASKGWMPRTWTSPSMLVAGAIYLVAAAAVVGIGSGIIRL